MAARVLFTETATVGVAAAVVPQQATTPQQSDAQAQAELRQSAAELRRAAQENARAQIEAARAQIEASRNRQQSVVIEPPTPPGVPVVPRITITRDGQPPIVVGGGGGSGPVTTSTAPHGPDVFYRSDIPEGVVTLSIAFFIMLAFIAVGLPLARAWARRMDRQSSAVPAPFPSDVTNRLERIEHAVESIAIEVERVSEGQRFTTKLLAERPDLGAPVPAVRQDQIAGGGR